MHFDKSDTTTGSLFESAAYRLLLISSARSTWQWISATVLFVLGLMLLALFPNLRSVGIVLAIGTFAWRLLRQSHVSASDAKYCLQELKPIAEDSAQPDRSRRKYQQGG